MAALALGPWTLTFIITACKHIWHCQGVIKKFNTFYDLRVSSKVTIWATDLQYVCKRLYLLKIVLQIRLSVANEQQKLKLMGFLVIEDLLKCLKSKIIYKEWQIMKCYCLRIIQISVLSLSTETLQSTLKRPDRLEFSFNLKQTIVLCA